MDLIFTHPSGAQLWQGGQHDVEQLLRVPDPAIQVIGLFAQEYQPDDHTGRYELLKAGYDDNFAASMDELLSDMDLADRASDIFSDRLRSGKGCLSSCAMGLNRSGLVTGMTLIKAAGISPAEAIGRIRRLRSSAALSNPGFVQILHQMGDTRGSKSSWTKWSRKSIDI
ncbi:MAG: hypothetical protein AB7L09_03510 [Nitrospira sp.]